MREAIGRAVDAEHDAVPHVLDAKVGAVAPVAVLHPQLIPAVAGRAVDAAVRLVGAFGKFELEAPRAGHAPAPFVGVVLPGMVR